MLERFDLRVDDFARRIALRPEGVLAADAQGYGFVCRRYELCSW